MEFAAFALPKMKKRRTYASEGPGEAEENFDNRADLASLICCFHESDFAIEG